MPVANALVGQTAPVSKMPKSTFKWNVPGFASMNFGRIYPVYMEYIEPHTKKVMSVAQVIRGQTPITTVMGNAVEELFAFSVPWRIMWNYAKQFFGENDTSAWTQQNNYTKPQVELRIGSLVIAPRDSSTTLNFSSGSRNISISNLIYSTEDFDLVKIGDLGNTEVSAAALAGYIDNTSIDYSLYVNVMNSDCYGVNKVMDYLGIHPIPKDADSALLYEMFKTAATKDTSGYYNMTFKVDALPLRAFFMVVNYYFRDQNYQSPYLFSKDNGDLKLGVTHNESGRLPMPYDFMERRFITGDYKHVSTTKTYEGSAYVPPASRLKDPFSTIVPEPQKGDQYDLLSLGGLAPLTAGSLHGTNDLIKFGDSTVSGYVTAGDLATGPSGALSYKAASGSLSGNLDMTNLYADLSNATAITIAKFREWVVLNQWTEKAVKGTRYAEVMAEFYGVPVNPELLDEPRFLGGVRVPLNTWQVAQTAPNSDGSGVGDLGAFMHTRDNSDLFVASFDEPSILLICAVSRVEHFFAQQLDPHWLRKDKFDEHYMLFDGLGLQPLKKEIPYFPFGVIKQNGGLSSVTDELGFQESYWEERFKLGNAAGVLNRSNPYNLSYYVYNELPTESPTSAPEYLSAYRDAEIVDSTLQLGSQASLYAQQLLVSFNFAQVTAKMISKSGRNPGLDRI